MRKLKFSSIYLILFLGISISFWACQNDNNSNSNPQPSAENDYFIEASLLGNYSLSKVQTLFAMSQDYSPEIANKLKYGVKVYKVTYQTEYLDGSKITASGAVIIPNTSEAMDIISYQHGTIGDNSEAPSNFLQSIDLYVSPSVFASIGYISVLPDYIGYGSSDSFNHPYEHGASLATASRDMIRAVREFIDQENEVNRTDKLFLTGYSEGASASMALHKLLQENHTDEFTVTATSCVAGAYDKKAFIEFIMDTDEQLTYLNFYMWVLDTYNEIYNINKPYNNFYNEPYASQVQTQGVFANLSSKNPQDVFQENFVNGVKSGTETEMISAMQDNSYYDFEPNAPVLLVHGTEDTFVPYFNTEKAYNEMTNNGVNVTLKKVEGDNHFTIIPDYNIETVNFFEQF